MIAWIKKKLGIHVHEPKLFVIPPYCVVKCVVCGNESIPWEAPAKAIAQAQIIGHHKNDAEEMQAIDKRIANKARRKKK